MSDIPAKAALVALLQRAHLEVTAAAKQLTTSAAGKPIAWEKLFPGQGTLGLADEACMTNRTCGRNTGCTNTNSGPYARTG